MIPESDIQSIITAILKREGGNVDDPLDNGGETHFGITMPFASQWHIPWPPTLQDARAGYRRMLAGTKIDQIPDAATMGLVADCAVNHGEGRAIKWLQASLHVDVDGIIGPKTLAAFPALNILWPPIHGQVLTQRIKFYGAICVNDPTQLKFLNGWLNRACEFLT